MRKGQAEVELFTSSGVSSFLKIDEAGDNIPDGCAATRRRELFWVGLEPPIISPPALRPGRRPRTAGRSAQGVGGRGAVANPIWMGISFPHWQLELSVFCCPSRCLRFQFWSCFKAFGLSVRLSCIALVCDCSLHRMQRSFSAITHGLFWELSIAFRGHIWHILAGWLMGDVTGVS